MKPIEPHQRKVVSIHDADAWAPFDASGEAEQGTAQIRLNPKGARDVGFYIYRMEPGSHSMPHRHGGAEEFLMVEGELIDNDGTVYRAGDVVWLAPGTEHTSHTKTGCLVAVYAEAAEETPG